MGVSGKAVSKWECGLTTPDISIVNSLADELGITTKELLSGKQDFNINSCNNIVKKFDYIRRNIYFFIIILMLIILNVMLIVFVYKNYNKYGYVKFSLNNETFCSEGYIISQKNKEIVFLKELVYQSIDKGTDKELKIEKLKISIINDDKVIFNYVFDEQYDENGKIKSFYISDLLENFSIIINENDKDENKIKINKDKLVLLLEYTTSEKEKISASFDLSVIEEEYNNSWFG